MFHANPSDPSLSYTIRYIGLPENAVPYRPRSARRTRRLIATVAGAVLLTAGLAAGVAASRPGTANDAGSPDVLGGAVDGVPGEFRLGPGNGRPVGYVGRAEADRVAGEFRLGPGNQEPPGYVIVDPIVTAGDGVPGEFRLGPGNQQPPGYVGAR